MRKEEEDTKKYGRGKIDIKERRGRKKGEDERKNASKEE